MATGTGLEAPPSKGRKVEPLYPSGMFETPGAFDACPLNRLAEYMRDGEWIDLRTDEGVVERVRIVEIVVRVRGEDIIVEQWWLTDDEDCDRYRRTFAIDSDAIWKALPTSYRLEQVAPWKLGEELPDRDAWREPMTEQMMEHAVATAIKAACFLFGLKLEELRSVRDIKPGLVTARYAALLVIYEVTDLPPKSCCEALGYASQMPWQSARWKVKQNPEFRRTAVNLGKLVADQLDNTYRRSQLFPRDYSPVVP